MKIRRLGVISRSLTASVLALTVLAVPPSPVSSIAVAAVQEAAAQDALYLGPKFRPGQVMVYEQIANSTGSFSFDADIFPIVANATTVLRVTVNQVHDDGSADLMLTYDRVAMKGTAFFGGDYNVDSTLDPKAASSPELGRIATLFKDARMDIKVGPDGQVTEITGNQPLYDEVLQVSQIAGRSGEFTFESLSQLLESMWMVGSTAAERSPGEPWNENQESPFQGAGTLVVDSNFNVVSVDDQRAVIELDLTMELVPGPEGAETEPAEPVDSDEPNLDMENIQFVTDAASGRVVWDRTRNEVLYRTSELSFIYSYDQQPLFGEQKTVTTTITQSVRTFSRRIETEAGRDDYDMSDLPADVPRDQTFISPIEKLPPVAPSYQRPGTGSRPAEPGSEEPAAEEPATGDDPS